MKTLGAYLMLFTCGPFMSHAQAQHPLTRLVGNTRVLLVFAPGGKDPRLLEQTRLLKRHARELTDLDLLVIPVVTQANDVEQPSSQPLPLATFISMNEQTYLRRRFHVEREEFAVLLLGKDGGEKLREHKPLTLERLTTVIDAMPMRQQEVRDRKRR